MKLFNKYKNKNFTFITNYINHCINDESLALTEEELRRQLSGTAQSTFEEFILALTNTIKGTNNYNASILHKEEETGRFLPIRQINLPIRTTIAEKAWLYYLLESSSSDLFLDKELKERLLSALESDLDRNRFAIKKDYIDIRRLSPEDASPSPEYIANFKMIVEAIKSQRYLTVTNHSYSSQIYPKQQVIPYKLEYSTQFDSFSLSCYPLDAQRPVKMNLKNLTDITLGEKINDYDTFLTHYQQLLKDTKEKQPITIEIKNESDVYDRCTYLFSSFDTFCYDKGDHTLVMNIYYYRFQKEEILQNILFLGHYVKVVSPDFIVDKIKQIIREALQSYSLDADENRNIR